MIKSKKNNKVKVIDKKELCQQKATFGFLSDINGDKCQRTLWGSISGATTIVLVIIVTFYGLGHDIRCPSLIADLLLGMMAMVVGLLVVTALQRPRDISQHGRGLLINDRNNT